MSDEETRAVPAREDRKTRFRQAGPSDAETVALLHGDSWRRRFRGAYAERLEDIKFLVRDRGPNNGLINEYTRAA